MWEGTAEWFSFTVGYTIVPKSSANARTSCSRILEQHCPYNQTEPGRCYSCAFNKSAPFYPDIHKRYHLLKRMGDIREYVATRSSMYASVIAPFEKRVRAHCTDFVRCTAMGTIIVQVIKSKNGAVIPTSNAPPSSTSSAKTR